MPSPEWKRKAMGNRKGSTALQKVDQGRIYEMRRACIGILGLWRETYRRFLSQIASLKRRETGQGGRELRTMAGP